MPEGHGAAFIGGVGQGNQQQRAKADGQRSQPLVFLLEFAVYAHKPQGRFPRLKYQHFIVEFFRSLSVRHLSC